MLQLLDILTGDYSRAYILTGSEVPLLSFAARLRACRNSNQLYFLPKPSPSAGRPTLTTTTFNINPVPFSPLPSAEVILFMVPLGLGLVLREWLALCVPPPLKDFRRLGREMRTMVDGRKLPALIRLFGLGWLLLLTAQQRSL